MLAHPDMITVVRKEPHKMFLEKISRDVALHGSVPFYEISEMKYKTIRRRPRRAHKTGLAPTATISPEEELMVRLNSFFVALE